MKNIVLKFILLLSGLIIAILISELLLRLFWNPEYLNNKYKRDDLEWMKKNVVLNNFGYRDENVNLKKENTFRIYSLGDSYTFGWYINDGKKAYPNLMESKLGEKLGLGRVDVINAAQPGFTIDEEYDRYLNEGILFAPEIITVGINIYDLAGREFSPNIKRNIFSNLRIYELLVNNSIRKRSTQNTENEILSATEENSPQLNKLKDTLSKFRESTQKNGSRLVLIVFPNYNHSNPNSEYKNSSFHIQLNNLANELGLEIIDLFEPFNKIDDKARLILNPTDPHPSEFANEIAAEYISEKLSIDLKNSTSQNMKESFLLVGEEFDSLNAIFDISPREDWVYFNRQFGLGTQKNYLNDIKDRKTAYMADYLKTAKAFTHQGWPGAQVEYNFPSTGNKLEIGNTLYVLPVIGIHQVAGYYRQSGALNTEYIAFEDLLIKRDESGISIEVNSPLNFDFFRLLVDVGVRQFDIEGKRVVSLFKTDVIEQELPQMTQEVTLDLKSSGDINLSLPTYSSYDATTNYIWLNDQMVEANIVRKNNQLEIKSSDFFDRGKIKIYFSNELNYPPEEAPKVSYI